MSGSSKKHKKRMNVLIVAPIVLPISPHLKYAGTERVIDGLHEQLDKNPRIRSIVAASGDSEPSGGGRMINIEHKSLWKLDGVRRRIIEIKKTHERHFEFCLDYAIHNNIDIIHDNADLLYSDAYWNRRHILKAPVIATLHGDVSRKERHRYKLWRKLQREGLPVYFAAISNAQKKKFEKKAGIKVFDYVYNGVPVERYPYLDKSKKQDYIFWIGRVCRDKGTDLAIKLARLTGRPLIIAGEVHTPDERYYRKEIKPYITGHLDGRSSREKENSRNRLLERLDRGEKIINPGEILFIGPLDDRQKMIAYSRAYAVIVLNRWEEPFGLVIPEAMATGTPVIGIKRGSIPEIVVNNVTGFVVPVHWKNKALDEKQILQRARTALDRVPKLRSIDCRRHVEDNFSTAIMAANYTKLYLRVLDIQSKLKEKEANKELIESDNRAYAIEQA